MKKVISPLFRFAYDGNREFQFSDPRFSIQRLELSERWFSCELFSKLDREYCELEEWAIIIEGEEPFDGDFEDLNLLLVTFFVFSDNGSPFIKYRFSDDFGLCRRIQDTLETNRVESSELQTYSISDLKRVDDGFQALKRAHMATDCSRAHNAIYFLFLATHTVHWMQSFVFWMSSLEAIFSKDSPGAATATIKRRVSRYVDNPVICTESDIGDLYDVRSRIAHGDIRVKRDPKENLKDLKKLERIARACFLKLIEQNDLVHFATKSNREYFVTKLDRNVDLH